MSSLSTFSKTFHKNLCEIDFPELFVEKLSEKPNDLLLFFAQACLNRTFVRKKFGLMTLVLIRINEFTFSQVLNWEEVMKVYNLYIRFGDGLNHLLPVELEIRSEEELHCYSRIVFMQKCPALKKLWLKDPS